MVASFVVPFIGVISYLRNKQMHKRPNNCQKIFALRCSWLWKCQWSELGNGYIYPQPQIATNLFVEGAARGYAKLVGVKLSTTLKELQLSQRDLVILKVSAFGTGTFSYTCDSADESVYAVGNPRGLEGTFSQGISVASERLERT